ncbi:hypothetical protein COEX109129_07895 [Corallococcus exiguus]
MSAPPPSSMNRIPSLMLAGAALFLSFVMYGVFMVRHLFKSEDALIRIAAWHLPVAGLAIALSVHASVKHRSNAGLGLLVCSVFAVLLFLCFSTS